MTGRFEEAREWFTRARRVLEEQEARPLRARVDLDEAELFARRDAPGDRETALALIEQAVPQFRDIGMPGFLRGAEQLRSRLQI